LILKNSPRSIITGEKIAFKGCETSPKGKAFAPVVQPEQGAA